VTTPRTKPLSPEWEAYLADHDNTALRDALIEQYIADAREVIYKWTGREPVRDGERVNDAELMTAAMDALVKGVERFRREGAAGPHHYIINVCVARPVAKKARELASKPRTQPLELALRDGEETRRLLDEPKAVERADVCRDWKRKYERPRGVARTPGLPGTARGTAGETEGASVSKSVARIAREQGVTLRKAYRDLRFAEAIDAIGAKLGIDWRAAIQETAKIPRKHLGQVADLPASELRALVAAVADGARVQGLLGVKGPSGFARARAAFLAQTPDDVLRFIAWLNARAARAIATATASGTGRNPPARAWRNTGRTRPATSWGISRADIVTTWTTRQTRSHDISPSNGNFPWASATPRRLSPWRPKRQSKRRQNRMSVDVLEYSAVGSGLRVDRKAGVIRGVKLLGRQSKNGGVYSDAAIRGAVRLYRNLPVYIGHPERSRPETERNPVDKFGWVE
jgi:hypothetical protein